MLSHGGSLLLLDIHSCKIVVIFEATEKPDRERIKDFTISPTGRHLIVCTDTVKVLGNSMLAVSSVRFTLSLPNSNS